MSAVSKADLIWLPRWWAVPRMHCVVVGLVHILKEEVSSPAVGSALQLQRVVAGPVNFHSRFIAACAWRAVGALLPACNRCGIDVANGHERVCATAPIF